jgi:hypothetical protein
MPSLPPSVVVVVVVGGADDGMSPSKGATAVADVDASLCAAL